jgi:NAD(P)-dependent dehydrogenase (short-subunit alcohol dehydrogenase family)
VDVTSEQALQTLAQRLTGETLDLLILNAGTAHRDTLAELDFDKIREQIEVNSLGPLRCVVALLRNLRPGSKVALITSRLGSIADNTSGRRYGYRMSKAALNIAGVSLAHDLRERGIAVVLLHPGFVRTDMTRGEGDLSPDQAAQGLLARIDELTLETSGRFLHQNGTTLPW